MRSGFDNELGDLIVSVADEITSPEGNRFEVLGHLGKGTFGQVLKVRTGDNQVMALKVIRNRHAYRKQAEVEVELLRRLRVRALLLPASPFESRLIGLRAPPLQRIRRPLHERPGSLPIGSGSMLGLSRGRGIEKAKDRLRFRGGYTDVRFVCVFG